MNTVTKACDLECSFIFNTSHFIKPVACVMSELGGVCITWLGLSLCCKFSN